MKKIILLLLLILIATPVLANDSLGYFRAEVERQLGSIYSSTVLPDSVLNEEINRACGELVAMVGSQIPVVLKQDTVYLSPNSEQYSLNLDLFKTLAVYPLRYDRPALDYMGISTFGKAPQGQDVIIRKFIPLDVSQKLIVYPRPAVEDTLLVFYNAYANNLTADSSHTNIRTEFSCLIIFYALGLAEARLQNFSEASYYFSMFDQELRELMTIYANQPLDVVVEQRLVPR